MKNDAVQWAIIFALLLIASCSWVWSLAAQQGDRDAQRIDALETQVAELQK